jgi:hypothetical protein
MHKMTNKQKKRCLFILIFPAAVLILLASSGTGGAPLRPQESGGVTTGARWTGSIKIDEPEQRALGIYSSRQARFTVTLVEKISPGGSVSLELEHLDWSQERKVRDAINRGYESFRWTERGSGGDAGGSEKCSGSGSISYGEDKSRPFGITGHYSLNLKARGTFYKSGYSTTADHVKTGPMSHALVPRRDSISEQSEGGIGVSISGELMNGMTAMKGERGGTSWSLFKAALPVEVELSPVDQESYESFIPSLRRGVGAKVEIVGSSGLVGYPYFELEEVSTMPGYCMNAEIDEENLAYIHALPGMSGYGRDGPDLILDASENDYFIQGQLQAAKGKDAGRQDTLSVMALDAGAVGKLRAYMIIDGVPYQAKVKDTGDYFLSLPMDTNPQNLIADAAEQNDGAAFDSDVDNTPAENGETGDGLTAYEEYRGFVVAGGSHVRTDSKRKTIFVRNRYGHYWLAYRLLGLEAYDIEEDQLPPANAITKPGYINYFHEDYGGNTVHTRDQYVVIMKQSFLPRVFGADAYCTGLHPPAEGRQDVKILPEFMLRKSAARHPEIPFDEYLRRLIDHELGHRIGIDHHGNLDKKKYTDDDGRWWGWVALRGGQHSGDEDCLMRYHIAWGYLDLPGIVVEHDFPVRGGDYCSEVKADEVCGLPDVRPACRQQFWIKSPTLR